MMKKDVLVRWPLWQRFALGIVMISMLALVSITFIISYFNAENDRINAEDSNFSSNGQRTQIISEYFSNAVSNVRFHLSVTASMVSPEARNAITRNFFQINRSIAAISTENGDLINTPFFNLNKLDPTLLNVSKILLKDDMDRAAYGQTIVRNLSASFGIPMLAILFPSDFSDTAVLVLLSSGNDIQVFGSSVHQSQLLNNSGELLIGPTIEETRAGISTMSNAFRNEIQNSGINTMQILTQNNSGENFFCAYSKIPEFNIVMLTTVPSTAVYENVIKSMQRNFYLAGIILAMAISFAWFFSRGISHPLSVLTVAARNIENGNYKIDDSTMTLLNRKRKDEVGVLSEAFITMGESLEESHYELKKANEGLEQTVRERTAQLEEQSIAANNANKAKSDFLAVMSHEIRTPMNAVMGMIDLMDTDNLRKEQIASFNAIKTMNHSLLDIINNILDISKIEAGKLDLVPVDYDIHALFDNVIMVNKFSAEKKNLSLLSTREKNMPEYIFGDETRVRQIFTNIISNAIKYTPEGSVEVRLYKHDADSFVFECKDTGLGIKESDMPKLFGNFERLDSHKNRAVQGTGLGLPIVKQLVDMMQGTIDVHSVYGKGSTFTVRLPYVAGDKTKAESQFKDTQFVMAKPGADIKILVADDIPMNLIVATGLLRKHGIEADTADGGIEAVEKVNNKSEQYDIVFMDHLMPDIDGLEVAKRLRAQGWTMPIIALTANVVGEIKQQCIEAGMNDYLSKPIMPAQLNAMLAKWLPSDKFVYENTETLNKTAPKTRAKKPVLIDVERGLEYAGGDKALYKKNLLGFCNGLDIACDTLREYLENENWKEYAIIAHGYKGASATIGAQGISELAKELEFAGKAAAKGSKRDREICRKKTGMLISNLQLLEQKIKKSIGNAKPKKRYHISDAELIKTMQVLKEACAQYVGSEALRIAGLLEEIEGQGKRQKALLQNVDKIVASVNNIDYSKTVRLIDSALKGETENV
ncbi:MAG: response regulator [Spirochaetaceae bacterium]|jgi:signal transduction histidine kinase/DNA-binding NarL/FixJ family response regulator/HPt (histidine-containing phosphotransfer) domain-containing protein|nr:response regulator [Spirochaetaceae bacterium]